jgi:hypothetical protein
VAESACLDVAARPLVSRGDLICVDRSEMEDHPTRPGAVARIERGSYGFEIAVLCTMPGNDGRRLYRGLVRDVW